MIGYPGAILHPSPNFRQGRRAAIDWIVLHTTESNTLTGSLDTLTDPYREMVNPATGEMQPARVSAHYLVDDSGIYQLVSDTDESWAAGVHNPHVINIEVVGEAADPTTWSAPIVENLGTLSGWLAQEYGIPLVYRADETEPDLARGFVAHGALQADRYDPGIWFPWPQVRAVASRVANGAADVATEFAPVVALLLVALGILWIMK